MSGEFVKIHVERFRIGEDGLREDTACADHTFSATQLGRMQGRVLQATVWDLIEQTAQTLAEGDQ